MTARSLAKVAIGGTYVALLPVAVATDGVDWWALLGAPMSAVLLYEGLRDMRRTSRRG